MHLLWHQAKEQIIPSSLYLSSITHRFLTPKTLSTVEEGFDLKVAKEAIASPEPLLRRREEEPSAQPARLSLQSSGDKASIMCSALRIKGEVIGTISVRGKVASAPREALFTPEDADLFATLSHETTVALKNAQLYREVQKLFLDAVASLAATIDAKDPLYRASFGARSSLFAGYCRGVKIPSKG